MEIPFARSHECSGLDIEARAEEYADRGGDHSLKRLAGRRRSAPPENIQARMANTLSRAPGLACAPRKVAPEYRNGLIHMGPAWWVRRFPPADPSPSEAYPSDAAEAPTCEALMVSATAGFRDCGVMC